MGDRLTDLFFCVVPNLSGFLTKGLIFISVSYLQMTIIAIFYTISVEICTIGYSSIALQCSPNRKEEYSYGKTSFG